MAIIRLYASHNGPLFSKINQRISKGRRNSSEGEKLLGLRVSVWSGALRHFIKPYYHTMIMWVRVCANVTSHLVHISLGGPLFAEALLLHGFGIVDLLGLLQSLRGGLDVLNGLQGGRHLLFRLATHKCFA